MTASLVSDSNAAGTVSTALGPFADRQMGLSGFVGQMEPCEMLSMTYSICQRLVDLQVSFDVKEFGFGDAARSDRDRLVLGLEFVHNTEELFALFGGAHHVRFGADLREETRQSRQHFLSVLGDDYVSVRDVAC